MVETVLIPATDTVAEIAAVSTDETVNLAAVRIAVALGAGSRSKLEVVMWFRRRCCTVALYAGNSTVGAAERVVSLSVHIKSECGR